MRWLARAAAWFAGRPEPAAGAAASGAAAFTRPANWPDAVHVARLLSAAGVRFVLVGGYALHANGLVRATGDVDVLVEDTPENNRRWISALSTLPDGAARGLAGEDRPFPVEPDYLGDEPGVIRINDAFTVDVMPRACGLSYADLAPHIAMLSVDGVEIPVLDLKGLLRTKQGVRAKDVADRQQIELALARLEP